MEIKNLREVPIKDVRIDDNFWNSRLKTNRGVTLEHEYQQLEKTGRLDNFRKVAGELDGEFQGMFFNDSDVYKWLEAASYTLENHQDQQLKERIDEAIRLIAVAQQKDGYINTYFTLEEPGKRWTNLGMMHELYCAGHLFQAAVAHYRATASRKLLDIACSFADHIDRVFRKQGHKGVPGHEEIELALVELYRATGRKDYLRLAEYFINNRGHSYFAEELERLEELAGTDFEQDIENFDTFHMEEFYREFFLDETGEYDGSYAQDHLPVREQETVEGHAVRAMYLYSGMTEIARETGDQSLIQALERLWTNMTTKRMYITGGIGSTHAYEGFTEDYDLPNKTAYAESCAAVGSIMWNHRLLQLSGEARFADIIERTLYNGLLAGVGLSGDEFFYVNPLASDGDHHRKGWFHVSCCPPNIARLLASLEKYLYLQDDEGIYLSQYISGEVNFSLPDSGQITLIQQTDYPWDGDINLKIGVEEPTEFKIYLRIPEWTGRYIIKVNGEKYRDSSMMNPIEKGFVEVSRQWKDGDQLKLELVMNVIRYKAHPAVKENFDKVALQRGPLVYCLEEEDTPVPPSKLFFPLDFGFIEEYREDLLGGIVVIKGRAVAPDADWDGRLYRKERNCSGEEVEYQAIPYHLWDHRQPGEMRVWLE